MLPSYVTKKVLLAGSPSELAAIARTFLDDLGFSHFSFCFGTQTSKIQFDSVSVFLNDYPEEWKKHYSAQNYMKTDLIHQKALNTTGPITWSSLKAREIPLNAALIFNEASEFKIQDGVSIPVRSLDNLFSLFSAVADGTPIERQQAIIQHTGTLMILATLLHDRAIELFKSMGRSLNGLSPLTRRETDVLSWAAEGKTSADIAQILNISASTVDKHVEHIMAKFQTSTRTHAAVRALSHGLIETI